MFICNVKQYVHSHLKILYITEELEYKNNSLHANPLAQSPGKVKLDSDK
jgi:hypothetical protein